MHASAFLIAAVALTTAAAAPYNNPTNSTAPYCNTTQVWVPDQNNKDANIYCGTDVWHELLFTKTNSTATAYDCLMLLAPMSNEVGHHEVRGAGSNGTFVPLMTRGSCTFAVRLAEDARAEAGKNETVWFGGRDMAIIVQTVAQTGHMGAQGKVSCQSGSGGQAGVEWEIC